MRKDYRVHNPYDLRKSIGKYHQTKYLKQYYKFYSSDDNSIRTELSNLANNETGSQGASVEMSTLSKFITAAHVTKIPTNE